MNQNSVAPFCDAEAVRLVTLMAPLSLYIRNAYVLLGYRNVAIDLGGCLKGLSITSQIYAGIKDRDVDNIIGGGVGEGNVRTLT